RVRGRAANSEYAALPLTRRASRVDLSPSGRGKDRRARWIHLIRMSVLKPVQPRRIGDQNLVQQRGIVVDIAVEQFDCLGIVQHTRLLPAGMRPVGAPD